MSNRRLLGTAFGAAYMVFVEAGGGVCLAGDVADLGALAAPYANVVAIDVSRELHEQNDK